jgi:hypothetical protein
MEQLDVAADTAMRRIWVDGRFRCFVLHAYGVFTCGSARCTSVQLRTALHFVLAVHTRGASAEEHRHRCRTVAGPLMKTLSGNTDADHLDSHTSARSRCTRSRRWLGGSPGRLASLDAEAFGMPRRCAELFRLLCCTLRPALHITQMYISIANVSSAATAKWWWIALWRRARAPYRRRCLHHCHCRHHRCRLCHRRLLRLQLWWQKRP